MTQMNTYGLIGLTEENVGIDRRFYTGLTNAANNAPVLAVSYNAGRVDVFLNGIKLVGNHSGNNDYDYTMDSTTGTGSTVTLTTGVAFVASDVVECVGYVSNSSNTITSYNPTPTSGDGGFNEFRNITHTASDLVNVFLNGVLLDDSDYTLAPSTNGGTVTIGNPALTASDVVVIQVIGALDNNNFVPAVGGTFTGPITGVDVNGTELVLDADGDTSITADTDDQIDVKIGGTDKVTIDATALKVDDIQEKTTNHGVEIESVFLKDGTISATSNSIDLSSGGAISMDIGSNAGDDLNIDSGKLVVEGDNGNVTIGTGNLIFGAAGNGIDFSNAADVATGESNINHILDDYEEGEYTPTVKIGSTTQSLVGNNQCHYTKIGRLVYIHGSVRFAKSGSGNISISLPFNPHGQISIGGGYWIDNGTYSNNHSGVVYPVNGSQLIYLVRHGEFNTNSGGTYLQQGAFVGSGYSRYIYFSVTYNVA